MAEVTDRAGETARARAALYRLLARVFTGRPTAGLLKGLKEKTVLEALAAYGVVFDADFIAAEEEEQAEEMAAEYTRLFFGPGPHIAPYESVFVLAGSEERPRLWGEATVRVADFYREAGLETAPGATPDHLSLELEAMAALAEAEADKRSAGDGETAARLLELQERFRREHLAGWVPALSREVRKISKNGFYHNMALLAENQVQAGCGGNGPAC
jgi:TorA maturation chaperone TorD